MSCRADNATVKRIRRPFGLLALAVALAGLTIHPAAAAQTCTNCAIPSGYTTVKGKSEVGCTNMDVVCKCNGVKSSQPMCLYPGGTLKAFGTPNPPNPK
jgi:hypothetical protein